MKKKWNWHAIGGFVFLVAFWTIVLIIAINCFVSCASPRVVDHHEYNAVGMDSARVVQMVDSRVQSVRAHMDSTMRAVTQQVTTQQETSEVERERITETITSWVDSLGREVRQEQRVTDRDVSRQQRLREERLVQEFETRLQQAINRQDSEWNAKLDMLRTHFERTDSIADLQLKGKAATNATESWLDKMDRAFGWLLIAAIIVLFILTRKYWLPMVRR